MMRSAKSMRSIQSSPGRWEIDKIFQLLQSLQGLTLGGECFLKEMPLTSSSHDENNWKSFSSESK